MKCAFCDSQAVDKGGEHLWDDWINKKIPKTRFNARKRLSIESKPIEFASRGLNEQIPSVCTKCNSGWMSDLTARMKTSFSGTILKGEPFSLYPRDAVLLAAFTFMKAIVTDQAFSPDPFFTRADRERLRINLTIPPMMKMWCAAHQGSSKHSFLSTSYTVTPDFGPLVGMEFFSYTYVTGNLALQLLAPRWKDIFDRGKRLVMLVPDAYWNPATIRFWPCEGKAFSWPPEQYIGDDTIQQFIYRFNAPINLR